MNPEQRRVLADLLIQWEDLYRQGQDTPAAILCKDHPELIETLTRQIAALKRVAWLDDKLEDDGDGPGDDPPDDPRPPKLLAGRYRLDQLIATGGFAEVWRAFDQELQRIIAIKIPKRTVIGSSESFLAEARRVARLKHPGILPVYDVGLDGTDCFFVSEYVEGGSLADRLTHGTVSADQACHWISSIADALDHAHRSGVIHRDVKPANILIDAHSRALLADFGIAQSSMKTGDFAPSIGTLRYMAPEQLDGQSAVPQSDIYSLAVVLHEALTGKPPYSSAEPNTLRREIGLGAHVSRDVPKRLAAILRKALQKDPGQRFGSAAELAAALWSLPRTRSMLPLAATAAAAGLLIFAAIYSQRHTTEHATSIAHQATSPAQTETLPPALEQQITAKAQKTTLRGHLEDLSQQLGVTISLDEDALKQQSVPMDFAFGIAAPNKSGLAVLQKLLAKADPKGRLTYVVRSDAGGRMTVLVTTHHNSALASPSHELAPAPRKDMPYPLPPFNRREWRSLPPNAGLVYRFDEASGWWQNYREPNPVEFWFRQTAITDDAILLDDPSRKMWITLTGTACNSRASPSYPHNITLASGAWVNESGSPYPPAFDERVTITSERDTLENYLVQLSQHTGIAISINGRALQSQGITKNQSFSLDVTEQPARDVLPLILTKADPERRLRAVLRGTDDGKTSIDITTQQALED